MRTTNILKLGALVLGSIVAGCGSSESSTGPGGNVGGGTSTSTGGKSGTSTTTTTGGANPTTGGATAAGGTSATVGGTSATTGGATGTATGGSQATGGSSTKVTGTGGKSSTGGTGATTGGKTSTGGSGTTTGGKSSTGTTTGGKSSTGGTASVGGTSSDVGGTSSVGGTTAVATGGSNGGCDKPAHLISDFEDTPGKGTIVDPPPVSTMDGYWYSFKESSCTNQKPASVDGAAVDSEQLPTAEQTECNKYAMHSTIGNCGSTSDLGKYSGFGAALHPTSSDGKLKGPVDLSAYDGVTFKIKGTSSSQIYVEFQTTDCIDSANGGTATSSNSDAFNCHGYLIKTVPTSWTEMHIPFGLTGVRWFPTAGSGGSSQCTTSEFCEAPVLDPKKIVDIQFALEGPFNEKPQSIASYDIWVDDLALYKFSETDNAGIGTTGTYTMTGNHPFPANKDFSGCTRPAGADGKLLIDAYAQWKSKFVSGNKVVSPEIDGGATVSEGIAYGMLLAVYFGDKTLFDALLGYWKGNPSQDSMLMNWKQPGGSGSASDADEDAAFALQMARKQWGSAYDADASAILSQFLAKNVDSSGNLTPGNNFTSSGASALWNPSYFAPAYYKYFATVDTANAAKWNGLVTKGYAYLNSISGSNGLVPAWCTSNCTSRGGGGYTDADKYQYDSHRMPWRTAMDACWYGTSDAKTYINKVVGFFAGKAGAGKSSNSGGLGTIGDIYDSSGSTTSNSANNSMSLLGCAGSGALAYTGTNAATFRDRVWAFLLEGHYTRNYMYTNGDSATKPGYTYYNATVGLLTALTMSGNFYIME